MQRQMSESTSHAFPSQHYLGPTHGIDRVTGKDATRTKRQTQRDDCYTLQGKVGDQRSITLPCSPSLPPPHTTTQHTQAHTHTLSLSQNHTHTRTHTHTHSLSLSLSLSLTKPHTHTHTCTHIHTHARTHSLSLKALPHLTVTSMPRTVLTEQPAPQATLSDCSKRWSLLLLGRRALP